MSVAGRGRKKEAVQPQKEGTIYYNDLDREDRIALVRMMMRDYTEFVTIVFSMARNSKFVRNWHFDVFQNVLMRIYTGLSNREIINTPPGSGKTDFCAKLWVVWCVLKAVYDNTGSTRWLYVSYAENLCEDVGGEIRDFLSSVWVSEMFGLVGSSSKSKTDFVFIDPNGNRHEFFATTMYGQATGKRAGFLDSGFFSGMLLIDDPMAPKDIFSAKKVEMLNGTFNNVLRSRLANDNIPVLMIQQRVSPIDSTWHLTESKEVVDIYNITKIPALINRSNLLKAVPAELQKEFLEKIDASPTQEISYWEKKEPTPSLVIRKEKTEFVFSAQYQQEPTAFAVKGVIFGAEMEQLEKSGRNQFIPVIGGLRTWTCWDLGRNDHTAIYFIQTIGKEIRLVHSFADRLKDITYYVKYVKDWAATNNVSFDAHIAPHDANVTDLTQKQGKSRKQVMEDDGLRNVIVVPRVQDKLYSIMALRKIFPQLFMYDEGLGEGYVAFKTYRREYNEVLRTYGDSPVHDWSSNYMDAMQQFAMYYESQTKQGDGSKMQLLNPHAGKGGGYG